MFFQETKEVQEVLFSWHIDPLTVYMLTEGYVPGNSCHQIIVPWKYLLPSRYYFTPFALESRKTIPYENQLTQFGVSVLHDVKHKLFQHEYVVLLDSQIEVPNKPSLISKLISRRMPVWNPERYFDEYTSADSVIFAVLRVYKLPVAISPNRFNGVGGGFFYKLLDSENDADSVFFEDYIPVISDSLFEREKESLLHFLKQNLSLSSYFDSTEKSQSALDDRLEIDKLFSSSADPHDFSSTLDYAHSEYKLVFDEAMARAPSLATTIHYLEHINPPQYGESEYLLKLTKKNDISAKLRLIEMYLRVCLKQAIWFSEKYGTDLEDSFQEATIGLAKSIGKYWAKPGRSFHSYFQTWIRQQQERMLWPTFCFFSCSAHVLAELASIRQQMVSARNRFERIPNVHNYFDSEIEEELKKLMAGHPWGFCLAPPLNIQTLCGPRNGEEEKRSHYCGLDYDDGCQGCVLPGYTVCDDCCNANCVPCIPSECELREEEATDQLFSDGEVFANRMVSEIDLTLMRETLADVLLCLRPKEADVIRRRFGLDPYTEEQTLEEAGQDLGLTRERVRQIESKAFEKLRQPERISQLAKLLPNWVSSCGFSSGLSFICVQDVSLNNPNAPFFTWLAKHHIVRKGGIPSGPFPTRIYLDFQSLTYSFTQVVASSTIDIHECKILLKRHLRMIKQHENSRNHKS